MPVFQRRILAGTYSFAAKRRDMLALVKRQREYEARAVTLSEKRRARFEQRGQLTPRERLARLLDPGMPFVELYNMANFLVDDPSPDTSVPGASMIGGIGFVSGVRCVLYVDDSGINAGAATTTSVTKSLGVLELALRHKLPFVHLVESAGANLLQYTVELWAHGGGMFYGLAKLSAAGIPTLAVLHGPSTAVAPTSPA